MPREQQRRPAREPPHDGLASDRPRFARRRGALTDRASAVAVAAFAVALSSPRGALAQSAHRSWHLEWNAPSQCPAADTVRSEVARLLTEQQDPAQPPSTIVVRATVTRRAGRWTVVLRTGPSRAGQRSSSRSLDDRDCAPLAEATALIAALAANPALGSRLLEARHTQSSGPPTPEREPVVEIIASASDSSRPAANAAPNSNATDTSAVAATAGGARERATLAAATESATTTTLPPIAIQHSARPSTPAAMSERIARAQRRAAPPPSRTPLEWSIGAAFATDSGLLPGWALGASAWGALRRGALRVEWSLGYSPERSALVPEHPTAGGLVTAYSTRVAGCYVARWNLFDLGGCATLEGAVVHGRGRGVSNPSEALAPRIATGLAVHGAVAPVPSFALFAEVGGALSLSRPAFYLEAIGTFFQTPALSVQSRIGVEVRF